MGISNKDGCLFKRFEFIFPNFAVQEFSAKLRVDSEEFTSNTTKEGQEMCKIKDQQTHLKKKKKARKCVSQPGSLRREGHASRTALQKHGVPVR